MADHQSLPHGNPLPNASLEEGNDIPTGWRFYGDAHHAQASWTPDGARTGGRCLAFFPPMQDAAWECEPVPVAAGRAYGLVWWTRFQGGEPWHWSYHSEFVGVIVRWLDGQGNEIGRVERKFHCLQTNGWQQAWIRLTPPGGTARATVAFVYRTGLETDGHVWVDDVELEALDPLPPIPDGHARVVLRIEDEVGKPLTARIWATTERGDHLFPTYSHRFSVPDVGFHAAPEDCWLDVPAGKITVGARRGFEYAPAEETAILREGETREVTLVLRRTIDMSREGWIAGDHHSHLFFHKHTQHPQMRPQDSFEIAKAEGLNYLSMDGEMIEFRANLDDKDKARDEGFVGEMGLEAVTDFYGHICLINVREDMPGGFPMRMVFWPTNEMVQDYVAAQGGAIIAAHPLSGVALAKFFDAVADPEHGCLARELAADVLLGRRVSYDVFSESSPPQRLGDMLTAYYHLLNLGRRVGVTASTDHYVDQGRAACGAWRTYARSAGLDFASIAEAYREGRTFATNAPLVAMDADGAGPGDEVRFSEPGEVAVELRATSQWGLEAAELVINGEVRRRWDASGGRIEVTDEVRIDETSWMAARIFGPKSAHVDSSPIADEPGQFHGQFAHTSPVYVRVGDAPFRPRKAAIEFCLEWVEAMARAVAAVEGKYLSADLKPYNVSGRDAFGRAMSRIAEAKRIGSEMLSGAF
ncbi:MAG: CehA/McbA family metallohydrolase [Armatimonadota bacterium]|nr:MAG: CehA/McbA family metallohydrolase [Armatimonadota bacterium]